MSDVTSALALHLVLDLNRSTNLRIDSGLVAVSGSRDEYDVNATGPVQGGETRLVAKEWKV